MFKKTTVLITLVFAAYVAAPVWATDLVCAKALAKVSSDHEPGYTVNKERGFLLAKTAVHTTSLTFDTWNLNLLRRGEIGVGPFHIPGVVAQDYQERSDRLGPLLTRFLTSADAPDVLSLQEVWTVKDQMTLLAVAAATGYKAVSQDVGPCKHHGLQVLVRQSTVQSMEPGGFESFPRGSRYTPGFEWLGNIWRGLLWIKFTLPDGQTVLVGNTHLTPFASYSAARAQQVSALGRALKTLSQGVDHVFIMGDLNIAADFEGTDEEAAGLKGVSWLYKQFGEVTQLRDTFRTVNPAELPGYTFNTDASRLQIKWSPTEMRIDYIWGAEQNEGVTQVVRASYTSFAEKLDEHGDVDANGIYPSDHFKLRTKVDLIKFPN